MGSGSRLLPDRRRDIVNWILDTGYLILDTGYLILDAGCWILDENGSNFIRSNNLIIEFQISDFSTEQHCGANNFEFPRTYPAMNR
jgi:hypothetical protein